VADKVRWAVEWVNVLCSGSRPYSDENGGKHARIMLLALTADVMELGLGFSLSDTPSRAQKRGWPWGCNGTKGRSTVGTLGENPCK
jgi:hypothetical protein